MLITGTNFNREAQVFIGGTQAGRQRSCSTRQRIIATDARPRRWRGQRHGRQQRRQRDAARRVHLRRGRAAAPAAKPHAGSGAGTDAAAAEHGGRRR